MDPTDMDHEHSRPEESQTAEPASPHAHLIASASPKGTYTFSQPNATTNLTMDLDNTAEDILMADIDNNGSDLELPNDTDTEEGLFINEDRPTSDDDISVRDDSNHNKSEDTAQISSETFEELQFCKRELRSTRENKRPAPTTWLDFDTTGDFDPQEEARRLRPHKKRAKLPRRKKLNLGSDGYQDELSTELRPQEHSRRVLCISFSSESSRAAFSELSKKVQLEVRPARGHFAEGYDLRKRKSARESSLLENIGFQTTGERRLASKQPCDLRNQPVARGCYDCLASGTERCSLLDDEHSWPCDECKANDTDCHLINEPELKLACTHCQYLGKRKKWLVCSFKYEQDPADHRGRCKQCQQDDHHNCVAGPQPETIHTRIRIAADGQPYTNKPSISPKTPSTSTCRQCLDSQRNCSFAAQSSQDDGGVCTACDMSGDICEPLGPRAPKQHRLRDPVSRIAPRKEPEGLAADEKPVPSPTRPSSPLFVMNQNPHPKPTDLEIITVSSSSPPPPSNPINGGSMTTITTKLSHPIRFDHKPDPSSPCSFCSCPRYPIIGLEPRTVEVIAWHDCSGYEELDGGHRGDGVQSTRVCAACTMARMRIMACDDHALKRLRLLGDVVLHSERAFEAALERLFDGDANDHNDRWCSVCCSLADWECCAGQFGRPGSEGCGLALCEACVVDLDRCGGSLEMMLTGLKDEPTARRPTGLRADYELLKFEGCLMGFVKSLEQA